ASDMCLLYIGLRAIEKAGLAVMITEALRAQSDLRFLHRTFKSTEATLGIGTRPRGLSCLCQTVWLIVGASLEHLGLHLPIPLQILKWAAFGAVHWDLMEVDGAEARELRVLIGKQPALQQRILGEVHTRRHVCRQKSDLLGLSEEVVWVAIKNQTA